MKTAKHQNECMQRNQPFVDQVALSLDGATFPLCVRRKELSSSHWDCYSSCNCVFISTTVETWLSKASAHCSAASARCSATSAHARAAASRYSEALIFACNLILSSVTQFIARMPTLREWFGFPPRASAKCSTIGMGAEEIFS
jgi:hypothetical protein